MNPAEITAPIVEAMLQSNPRDGGLWSTMGVFMRREGKIDAAVACQTRAVRFAPEHSGVWSNLGNVLLDQGRFAAAAAAQRRSAALAPEAQNGLFNLAIALRKGGRFNDAVTVLNRALTLTPGHAETMWERALCRLQIGDYRRGLAEYEVRRHIGAYRNRIAPGPMWDGGPLNGKTLFLSTEQGFGDALLMLRYVPLVAAKGGRIILERHREHERLVAGLSVDQVVDAGSALPAYDVQASLMSLPYLLGTTYETVPEPFRPHIPPESRAKAERLIGPRTDELKVGIVWSGRVTFSDNRRRATTLDRFLRFAAAPGVKLYSLQKGPPESQLAETACNALITPLGPHADDFSDTAAFIEKLDVVVMTDSSVAHLTGSLGKPVWNLLQYVPYWIYGFEGDRNPWYPSMRMFRQGPDEDWEPVFDAAAAKLAELAAARRADRI